MKKTLIIWLGAFGFAIAKHLGENNPQETFFAIERNQEVYQHIKENKTHPFFYPWVFLPDNIGVIDYEEIQYSDFDIIISIIPCQFLESFFQEVWDLLKPGVILVNLSKWINNTTLQTPGQTLESILGGKNYSYVYMAGGMIAQELVDWKTLWVDIVTTSKENGERIQNIFNSSTLHTNLKIENPYNTELYAALKNIVALILGYYEWLWNNPSTLGYYLCEIFKEMSLLISELWGSKILDFSDYSLWGDIIATCFWESRNRLLWNMLWKGIPISEALEKLREQKKIAEWYETLKGIYSITQEKQYFPHINNFAEKFLD